MSEYLYACLIYPACKLYISAHHCIVICGLSGSTIFFKLTHQRHDFGKKVFENKFFFLIFSTNFSKTFLILRIIQRGIIINAHKSSCKVAVILV